MAAEQVDAGTQKFTSTISIRNKLGQDQTVQRPAPNVANSHSGESTLKTNLQQFSFDNLVTSEGFTDDDEDDNYEDDDDDADDDENDLDDEDSGSETSDGHSKSRRRQRMRRGSQACGGSTRPGGDSCGCDHIATKIDCDGLPVTDVDLVTYKDLCHMEQAHHMRTSRPLARQPAEQSGANTGSSGYSLKPSSASMRRSSLQEESGAYYQLCTTNEEQNIRRKYLWFPPSLRRLELVDKFFAPFPRDKIPWVPEMTGNSPAAATTASSSLPGSALSGQKSTTTSEDPQQPSATATSVATPPISGSLASGSKQQHPAAGSYRDEQISFQLPRQDISLDYCSYQMDEAGRLAYGQFVERRNGHALDVGTVVQVRVPVIVTGREASSASSSSSSPPASQQPASSAAPSAGDPAATRANRLATFQRSESQAPIERRPEQRQRKASTISQSTAMGALVAFGQLQASSKQPAATTTLNQGPQRCRRCLVRFEDQELAVVAPNFIIGSALYQNHHVRPAQSPPVQHCRASRGPFAPPDTLAPMQQAAGDAPSIAPPNAALFHPNCFTCSTCKEFLVDLVYCLRDNKLYCLRHYGESLRPRCSWCQELIFSDEYLKAMNDSFHVDHFLCRHCDSNLAGQRYVLKEEKPFCIQCYEGNFANTCEDCHKAIGIDSRDLSYKDRHWHDSCFVCNKCQQSLIDKPFGSKGDKVYCADCYDVTFATRCDGCNNPFRAGSKKMEYRGRQWHDSCFCCCVCMNTIGSNSFIPKNEEIYCIKCYEDKYATRCTKCKLVIVSGGVTFRNEPWHRECFSCCNCNKSLAGQRFTTRDVAKETVNDTNKTNQPHNAYCIDCYGELFAKKCYACSKAITGLGGTRFVTFENRSWHNDCFICNDCNLSLVGKGFITDGPESILCGECARAKLR